MNASEIVDRELIVPICFIVSLVHAEALMVHAIVVPFAILIEHVHLPGIAVCIDHVQIQALMLFAPELPRSRPVVVPGYWDHVRHWHVQSVNSTHPQNFDLHQLSLRVKLHLENEVFGCEGTFHEKWN